jgi:hypothetical protein
MSLSSSQIFPSLTNRYTFFTFTFTHSKQFGPCLIDLTISGAGADNFWASQRRHRRPQGKHGVLGLHPVLDPDPMVLARRAFFHARAASQISPVCDWYWQNPRGRVFRACRHEV